MGGGESSPVFLASETSLQLLTHYLKYIMLYIGEKDFFSLSLFFTFIHVYRDTDVRQLEDYLMELVLSILWVSEIKLR